MRKLEIVSLLPEYEEEYLQFLLNTPDSFIYATPQFRDFLSFVTNGQPDYKLALENGRIVGALPSFRRQESGYGTVINSLPWYGSYGSCVVRDNLIREHLLRDHRVSLEADDVISATLILSPLENEWIEKYITVLFPQFLDYRIGQITLLPRKPPDIEDSLFKIILSKTRNLVRKSLRQGFILEITDSDWAWNFLYETHVENMTAVGGRAKPREHFDAMRHIIPASWRRLYIALKDGVPVAAMLLFFFNRTVEYVTPAIKHDYRPLQPLSFLIWSGLLDAVRADFTSWNWGGTWLTQKSLHHFKAGWGAIDLPYTYLINTKPEATPDIVRNLNKYQDKYPYFYLIPYSLSFS